MAASERAEIGLAVLLEKTSAKMMPSTTARSISIRSFKANPKIR
ncbi:MAG: hypothetical protein V8R80_08395 [Eubacterium sp.]